MILLHFTRDEEKGQPVELIYLLDDEDLDEIRADYADDGYDCTVIDTDVATSWGSTPTDRPLYTDSGAQRRDY